jgi:hypothetical protein
MFAWFQSIKLFFAKDRQTKYIILTLLLYMIALIWTTAQSYARLEYSRTDTTNHSQINK